MTFVSGGLLRNLLRSSGKEQRQNLKFPDDNAPFLPIQTKLIQSVELSRPLQPISDVDAFDSRAVYGITYPEGGVVLTVTCGSQGRDMKTWYRPLSLLLLASLAGGMCGCAQTSSWLTRNSSKKESDKKLADSKKKKSSDNKAKSAKEIAEMKSDDAKIAKSGNKPKTKVKSKSTDSEQTKIAAAGDRLKKAKPTFDPVGNDKDADAAVDNKAGLASSKTTKPSVKPTVPRIDDDVDTYMAKFDGPSQTSKKAVSKTSSDDRFDPFEDDGNLTKKNVVQVKKEVAKKENETETETVDWEDDAAAPSTKSTKLAKFGSDSFDNEADEATAAKDHEKLTEKKIASTDETSDFPAESYKKVGIKKAGGRGLNALCPDAEGELSTLLKEIDANDAESLKQGIHHIGQMGQKGTAAAPFLQKMLSHEDTFVRAHTALAMARLNLTSEDSIEVVTSSLKSRDASLRSFGIAVLAEMEPHSKQVLTSLSENLEDKDGQVRLRAAEILVRYQPFDRTALMTLISCLKDKNENVRWLATYSLAEVAPEEDEVVRSLLKASKDPVPKVRAGAIYALGEIGPFAKKLSHDELHRQLQSTPDEELKSAIKYSLEQMDK